MSKIIVTYKLLTRQGEVNQGAKERIRVIAIPDDVFEKDSSSIKKYIEENSEKIFGSRVSVIDFERIMNNLRKEIRNVLKEDLDTSNLDLSFVILKCTTNGVDAHLNNLLDDEMELEKLFVTGRNTAEVVVDVGSKKRQRYSIEIKKITRGR